MLISTQKIKRVEAREADKRSYFLYAEGQCEEPCPVHDYQLHVSAPQDEDEEETQLDADSEGLLETDLGEGEEASVLSLENTKPDTPYFLQARKKHRIVEFYSPWCGQCQNFRSKYIELAMEVQRRSPNNEIIEFYAVSCSAYHWVCQENRITGFPTILAFKSGSEEGINVSKLTARGISDIFNIKLKADDKIHKPNNGVPSNNKLGGTRNKALSTTLGAGATNEEKPDKVVDILGASADTYRRLKKDTFSDAALSLTYALRNDIFKRKKDDRGYAPLKQLEKDAFSDWIDLLYWTLPPTWRVHTLLNDLRSDMETALSDRNDLIHMVNHQDQVVNEYVKSSATWSSACSHDVESAGFTCGLWNLLHVISIGVAERHTAVLGSRSTVSVSHAALTMRNYIFYFLHTTCPYCRESFLSVYDNCGYNSCKRFANSKRKINGIESSDPWKELALWLWEFHNEINVLKLKDKLQKQGKELTNHDSASVIWPSRENCPQCFLTNGKWNYDQIYIHLKTEYWPGGVQNFRYVVLKAKPQDEKEPGFSFLSFLSRLFTASVTLVSFSLFIRRIRLYWTGRHKKHENRYR